MRFVPIALFCALLACNGDSTSTATGTVTGWVCLGPYQTPSAGALVSVHTEAGTFDGVADDNGYFDLDAAEGSGMLVISNRVDQRAAAIEIEEGETLEVSAACSFQTAALTVHLCESGSLTPRPAATVTLEYLEIGGARVTALQAQTNAAGDAVFNDLTPGRYHAMFLGLTDPLSVELQPTNQAQLEDPGCYDPTTVGSISGRTCNPFTGSPVANISVELDVSGEPLRETTSDADGRYRFDAVTPGTHVVTARPPAPQDPMSESVTVVAGETVVVASDCLVRDSGIVAGVVCNAGSAASDVTVGLEGGDEPARFVTTGPHGYFQLLDIPEGSYTLTFHLDPSESFDVTVVKSERAWQSTGCNDASFGAVSGRVCDPSHQPVSAIPVELDITSESSPRQTMTGSDGRFRFDLVPPGNHDVTVRPPLQPPVNVAVSVSAGLEEAIPSPQCGTGVVNPATLTGVACVGIDTPHILAGAKVQLDFDPGIKSTTAGLDGAFTLEDLPAGDATLTIARGRWRRELNVTLTENQTLNLGMALGHCVGPGTRVALVTGVYDTALVDAFLDMGLPVRQNESGTVVNASGVVDLYDGTTWADNLGFASSLSNLQPYDMILFASGLILNRLYETDPCGLPPSNTVECADYPGVVALENIDAYLQGGGSIYVSDWAYDIIRRQFPLLINFYSNDFIQAKALCGHAPLTPTAVVHWEPLAIVLGSGTVSITYQDNFEHWAAIDTLALQNPLVVPFLVADITVYEFANDVTKEGSQ